MTDPGIAGPRVPLRDGTWVELCPIGPEDRDDLVAGFRQLSRDSRQRRFFSALRELPAALLNHFTQADGWNHVAIGARRVRADGGVEPAIVAVARFVRLAERPDTAELAVAVIDAMQRKGLARLLLDVLARMARRRGITTFHALVLPDNEPMRALLRSLALPHSARHEGGDLAYEISLEAARAA